MWDIIEIGPPQIDDVVPLFDAYRVFYRQPSDPEGARKFLMQRAKLGQSIIYTAYDSEDRAVGFTQLYPLYSSTRMGKVWLLNDLFVDPDYRGNGISLQLIKRAKKLAVDTRALGLLLETEKTNTIGNNLYPRAGFHLETDTHHYFWPNETRGA